MMMISEKTFTVTGLHDGDYSDDMTLAAIDGAHKRLITSPPVAVFPHPLASDLTFVRYWNYLWKQTFVLESYITYANWIMNRALFFVHFYISWAFVAPYILSVIHIVAAFVHSAPDFLPSYWSIMRHLGYGMMRWKECPVTILAEFPKYLVSKQSWSWIFI